MHENFESYKRELDRVQVTEDGKRSLAESLSRRKTQTASRPRRMMAGRIAAVAAVVCLLAGTALAVGYWGRVKLDFIEDWTDGISEEQKAGYSVDLPEGCIPASRLSEEVLAVCADMSESDVNLPFRSWAEAETFLGVELADNARLEQMPKTNIEYRTDEQQWASSPCFVRVCKSHQEPLPSVISLHTSYQERNCHVGEIVEIVTDMAGDSVSERGFATALQGETEFQEYVTPSGMEVTIYSEVVPTESPTGTYDRTTYWAHFIKGNALFSVQLSSNEGWRAQLEREGQEFLDPWDTLIEILDAYE